MRYINAILNKPLSLIWISWMIIGLVTFYKALGYTVMWRTWNDFPEAFTNKQVVAEIWAATGYVQFLIAFLGLTLSRR